MLNQIGQNPNRESVEILIDGQPVTLPPSALESVSALKAALEYRALQEDRMLASLLIDGIAVNLHYQTPPLRGFRRVQAQTISFSQLSQQMAGAGLNQVDSLRERTETAVSLVLINNEAGGVRLIDDLETSLRALLILLSLLNELCGLRLQKLSVGSKSFAQHLEALSEIQPNLTAMVDLGNSLAVSDVLELRLLPWLSQLRFYLLRIHEQPEACL